MGGQRPIAIVDDGVIVDDGAVARRCGRRTRTGELWHGRTPPLTSPALPREGPLADLLGMAQSLVGDAGP
jgi:hypothetical protein